MSNGNAKMYPEACHADTAALLRRLAAKYETAAFIDQDPVRYARAAGGSIANREATAFVAASLSYGSRTQFLPKIGEIVDLAAGDVAGWIARGGYRANFDAGDSGSFYRLFSHAAMRRLFDSMAALIAGHGSISGFLRGEGADTGPKAIDALCRAFAGCAPVVPRDSTSACKRLCMFLRWMARDGSPVDIGLWSDWLDKRTLVMPLDVHVMRQAVRLGLARSSTASMRNARAITMKMLEVFPDDPLKGDFALYGLGIDASGQ